MPPPATLGVFSPPHFRNTLPEQSPITAHTALFTRTVDLASGLAFTRNMQIEQIHVDRLTNAIEDLSALIVTLNGINKEIYRMVGYVEKTIRYHEDEAGCDHDD